MKPLIAETSESRKRTLKCFNEKNQHVGVMHIIDTNCVDSILNVYNRTEWCSECGAVVIRRMVDGRHMGDTYPMQFPNLTRRELKK